MSLHSNSLPPAEAVIMLQPTVHVAALGSGLAHKLKWVWFEKAGMASKKFPPLSGSAPGYKLYFLHESS